MVMEVFCILILVPWFEYGLCPHKSSCVGNLVPKGAFLGCGQTFKRQGLV
jgi:hypothetical protein